MQTKFMIHNSSVQVFKLNQNTFLDKLPPQIYSVAFHPMMGYSLNVIKDTLELPTKIYGGAMARAEKCLKTYQNRSTSTGILLTGDKGTGKTLQMALLANKMVLELELPVIMVNQAYTGSQFTDFIESIGECCLIFDEFGKMYKANPQKRSEAEADAPSQGSLLSLMDGVDKTKRLIILTENSKYDVNEFMLNRPSRIYYHFKYKKLEEESITGFCEDNKISSNIIEEIIELSRRSVIFSFDMLQSIVEEHLRYKQPIKELIPDLNLDLSEKVMDKKRILKITNKTTEEVYPVKPEDSILTGLEQNYGAQVTFNHHTDDDGDPDYDQVYLEPHHLVYEKGDKVIYQVDNFEILLQTMPSVSQSYNVL